MIPSKKKNRLMESKDGLRKRIEKYFADNHPEYKPVFFIQGSYKMGTMIWTKDDHCDLDDGIYFYRQPDVTGTTLQNWVWEAVDGYTSTSPVHKAKCIRVLFKGDYHIDFPIYIQPEGHSPKLAVKNSNFELSDPKALVAWFDEQKDENGQLVRIIRYLKAWCDYKRNKMPSGLAMTIIGANNFVYDDRDDVALTATLTAIRRSLTNSFRCIVPVSPYDDLFADYGEDRKQYYLDALDAFIVSAEEALAEESQKEASKKWQQHFGRRFPLGADTESDERADALKSIADQFLVGSVVTTPKGTLADHSHAGVTHQPHRFFGDE